MKYIKLYEDFETVSDDMLMNIYKNGLRNKSEETKQYAIDRGFELNGENKQILLHYCIKIIVNYHLIKDFWEEKYEEIVKETTNLNISNMTINSFDGISCLVNLEEFIANNVNVTDLTPLLQFKELYLISLKENGLKTEDLIPLQQLENLSWVNVEDNEINDLEVLVEFKSLSELYIARNKITSLEPILFFKGMMEIFHYEPNPLLPDELDECSAGMGDSHPDGECVANHYGYSYMSGDENPLNLPYPNEESRK